MNAASIFVQMIGLIGAAVALQRTFRKARAASDVLLIFLKLDDARQYGAAACVFVIVWLALSLVHQLIS